MPVSGIFGGAGPAAVRNQHRLSIGDTVSSRIPDTSETGQLAVGCSQAVSASSPAQNTLLALLGSMEASGYSQNSTAASQSQPDVTAAPSPPLSQPDKGARSFGDDLASLLQSVLSGDMTGAQNAAAGLQSALAGTLTSATSASAAATQSTTSATTSAATSSTASTSEASASASTASATVPAAATTASSTSAASASAPGISATSTTASPATGQATVLTDLNSLLSAVQSGNAAASKTAAATLTKDLKSQPDALQALESETAQTSHHGRGPATSFRSSIETLLHSARSGNMTTAQSAATAVQAALDRTTAQSASSTSSATQAAGAGPDSTEPSFLTDFKSLLSAVQSGDATASKSAASTLMNDLKSQAEMFQVRLGHVVSSYTQWS